MALYKGTQKIAPIINKGNTIRNQNKNVTTNGTYTADNGYTGLGNVNVNVVYKSESLTVNANHNGTYTTTASQKNVDGFNTVEVKVNVPLQTKNYTISQADINNNTITITPDANYDGMSSIVIDLSTITNLLSQI